jgi:hypothetical protein
MTAERIAALRGSPSGTPGALVAQRSWDDYSIGRADALEHLGALDVVYTGIIEEQRDAIETTEELDPVTQDMLIAHSGQLEQFHWFVRAHLENAGGTLTTGNARTERTADGAAHGEQSGGVLSCLSHREVLEQTPACMTAETRPLRTARADGQRNSPHGLHRAERLVHVPQVDGKRQHGAVPASRPRSALGIVRSYLHRTVRRRCQRPGVLTHPERLCRATTMGRKSPCAPCAMRCFRSQGAPQRSR